MCLAGTVLDRYLAGIGVEQEILQLKRAAHRNEHDLVAVRNEGLVVGLFVVQEMDIFRGAPAFQRLILIALRVVRHDFQTL